MFTFYIGAECAEEEAPSQGSFLNLLPTHREVPENLEPSPHSSISSPDQLHTRA
jgi:hypothetical protein